MNDLLLLVHRLPFPPNKGDKIRSYHLLKQLSSRYRVHLGCFVDDANDMQYLGAVSKLCASTKFEEFNPGWRRLKSSIGLLSGQPLSIPYYFSQPMANWVRDAVEEHDVSTIVAYSSPMAQYVLGRNFLHCRRVMDFVDVDSDKWHQYGLQSSWPKRSLYLREARMLANFERKVAAEFDAAVFVTRNEVELFDQISPETRGKHHVVPNGVATDYFDPAQNYLTPYDNGAMPLVFTGMMDYWPNIDAMCWFSRNIFPRIRDRVGRAKLWIVGAAPTPEVQSLASIDGVCVTGRVPDVRPYLKYARLAVVPLRIARGVQNKVLEAMAMSCPVLCSPQAAAGLYDSECAPVTLADSEQEFVDQAINLLNEDEPLNGTCDARQYVLENYNWQRNLEWFTSAKSTTSLASLHPT
jgi:sugar transferase (PEP-CTERM/EpsH1 system associated)